MVQLSHPNGNVTRCPTGFSWTTLLFGPLVPLLRGWFAMVPIYIGGSFLTFGVFALVMPFQINRYWISYLLDVGFKPTTDADAQLIRGIGLPDENIPHWAASALKTYHTGEAVPYGLYVALNAFDYRFIGEENGTLDGLPATEYMHLPLLLTLALVPVLAVTFYFAFPVIVVGIVGVAAAKLLIRPLQSLFTKHAYMTRMHWDPVMAHMKTPNSTKESNKDKDVGVSEEPRSKDKQNE